MRLPSFFKRKDGPRPAPPRPMLADDAGPVQAARVRARRRLIGAVVLLAGRGRFPAAVRDAAAAAAGGHSDRVCRAAKALRHGTGALRAPGHRR
jgi:hypothetical protein